MANENSATGGRKAADRDRSYGGGRSGSSGGRAGGNENAAAGRLSAPQRDAAYGATGAALGRAMGRPERTDQNFITPKYGWDQAQISDFGIIGGLSNLLGGVIGGNTYAGRTPLGFGSGGNVGARSGGGNEKMNVAKMLAQQALAAAQKPIAQGPMAPPPPMAPPMTFGPKSLSVPGGMGYGVMTPGYQYRRAI